MYYDDLIVRNYVSPEPTFSTTGAEQVLPNVTATAMSIVPRESPCRVGICTVDINVTWTNYGGDWTFIPSIIVDSTTYSLSSQPLAAGASIPLSSAISGLSAGSHSICPSPN